MFLACDVSLIDSFDLTSKRICQSWVEFGYFDISLVSVLVKNIEDFDLIFKLLDQFNNTLLTVFATLRQNHQTR